jgi:hypothetical protein
VKQGVAGAEILPAGNTKSLRDPTGDSSRPHSARGVVARSFDQHEIVTFRQTFRGDLSKSPAKIFRCDEIPLTSFYP